MNRILSLICALGIVSLSMAQTNVIRYVPGTRHAGVVYALPKTEVVVVVKTQCVKEIPGPFYQYAERYLADKNFISHESTAWRVSKVDIKSNPIVDENKMYQVLFDKKGWSNNISFSSSCLIKGVNIPVHSRPNSFNQPGEKRGEVRKESKPEKQRDAAKCKQETFDYSCLNEEALVSSSIPKMAEMAAKQIYEIRENRAAIIGAELETMPDGTAVKTILKEMDKQEKELLALFLGKRIVVEERKEFSIIPTEDVVDFVIARISIDEGLKSAEDVMGEPIYINIKGEYKTVAEETKKEAKQKKGFYYNVPGNAEISVAVNNKVIERKQISVPQFGYSIALPASFIDKENGFLLFDTKTDEIRSMNSFFDK